MKNLSQMGFESVNRKCTRGGGASEAIICKPNSVSPSQVLSARVRKTYRLRKYQREKKKGGERKIYIASLNVRTLKSEENLDELENAFEESKFDVIGTSRGKKEKRGYNSNKTRKCFMS